jgi:trehalose synthase
MTSFVVEQVGAPTSTRDARVADAIRRRTVDELAGRTVWCATTIPAGEGSAERLRDRLRWTSESGVGAEALDIPADARLRKLSAGLEAMLTGSAARPARLDAGDREIYAGGHAGGDAAIEHRVRAGDVVFLHDPATAGVADAVREQGAHAIWQLRVGATGEAGAAHALAFLGEFTAALNAIVTASSLPPRRGVRVTRFTAVIPAADVVAAKDVVHAGEPTRPDGVPAGDLGLSSLLAYLLEADRAESVGGTLHPRPAVSPH